MKEIIFRMAVECDLDEIFQMFSAAIDEMERNGIHQWDELYPDRELLCEDINSRQLFVGLVDERIVCAYVLNNDCDAEYLSGDWKCQREYARIVHRLCVHPKYQNCGIAGQTMLHIEKQAAELGARSIRLDAFSKNPIALRLYEKLGYCITGRAEWRMGVFFLMEKSLI